MWIIIINVKYPIPIHCVTFFNDFDTCFVIRELLEHIKLFEERQFSGVKGDKDAKLLPMNEGGGAALLKIVNAQLDLLIKKWNYERNLDKNMVL